MGGQNSKSNLKRSSKASKLFDDKTSMKYLFAPKIQTIIINDEFNANAACGDMEWLAKKVAHRETIEFNESFNTKKASSDSVIMKKKPEGGMALNVNDDEFQLGQNIKNFQENPTSVSNPLLKNMAGQLSRSTLSQNNENETRKVINELCEINDYGETQPDTNTHCESCREAYTNVSVKAKDNKKRSIFTSSAGPVSKQQITRKKSFTVVESSDISGANRPERPSHTLEPDVSMSGNNDRTTPQLLSESSKNSSLMTRNNRPSTPEIPARASVRISIESIPVPKPKKLVVRGLTNFVKSRKRQMTSCSWNSTESWASSDRSYSRNHRTRGGGGPSIWKQEFPTKSRFHPDNYIYEWGEGPKAPPRPISAMAKCKRHGGRCDTCGVFTSDLCQSCRKCETDCGCPPNPYSPAGVRQEIFGGESWNKACKLLTTLTEDEKMKPVGGNAGKSRHNSDLNWVKNNLYKSQINVLNPLNVPLVETENCNPFVVPYSPPNFFPPLCPMPFMPPPMMPFYSPFPPPLPPYNYNSCPPAFPYPSVDCFMPSQN